MLCLKEDCFEEETIGKNFKIFKNKSKKYFGIVNGITGIEPIIQKIKKINTEMTVYILSYDGGNKIEEFEQVEKLVKGGKVATLEQICQIGKLVKGG